MRRRRLSCRSETTPDCPPSRVGGQESRQGRKEALAPILGSPSKVRWHEGSCHSFQDPPSGVGEKPGQGSQRSQLGPRSGREAGDRRSRETTQHPSFPPRLPCGACSGGYPDTGDANNPGPPNLSGSQRLLQLLLLLADLLLQFLEHGAARVGGPLRVRDPKWGESPCKSRAGRGALGFSPTPGTAGAGPRRRRLLPGLAGGSAHSPCGCRRRRRRVSFFRVPAAALGPPCSPGGGDNGSR